MSIFNPLELTDCTLQPDRIDIWQLALDTLCPKAEALLSTDELARANRFHFSHHRTRFIMARAQLRYLLAQYTGMNPEDVHFTYQSRGKPEIIHDTNIQFNLSHSKQHALLAIGQQYPLGIDLEFFSERSFEGIGQQVFSPNENKALALAPSHLKQLTFFNVWTEKEAFIKACGLGLHYPLEEITMPPLPQGHYPLYDAQHNTHWQLLSFSPFIDCCAALCYHPSVRTLRYAELQ